MSLVWVMWFIFWLISLCKISCLFVCLFALGLLKKSCLINLQTQDLFPTRPPAIAIGNTFSIVLLFFHAILVTIPSYKSVFPTHLLEERKVDFSFIKFLIFYCTVFICLFCLLSYPISCTCMIAIIMTVRFLYCIKLFWSNCSVIGDLMWKTQIPLHLDILSIPGNIWRNGTGWIQGRVSQQHLWHFYVDYNRK